VVFSTFFLVCLVVVLNKLQNHACVLGFVELLVAPSLLKLPPSRRMKVLEEV